MSKATEMMVSANMNTEFAVSRRFVEDSEFPHMEWVKSDAARNFAQMILDAEKFDVEKREGLVDEAFTYRFSTYVFTKDELINFVDAVIEQKIENAKLKWIG